MDSMIEIRNGSKRFGDGKTALHVLDNFSMTINKGSIYGFLGASGCGKTTVLSILVGKNKLDSGELTVDGGRSNALHGEKIGYMPQDHCLFGYLNISETFFYYGRIYSLEKSEIKTRMENLLNFLELHNIKSCIKNLSGGQKRRVSLGVALVHSPDFLILDEPTVGVDPLLRVKIWQHLTNLSKKENKTVLVTTHFVEEARQADTIGFMRSGRLLAEGKPDELMQIHGTISLEDVFINLCNQDNNGTISEPNSSNESLNGFIVEKSSKDNLVTDENKQIPKPWSLSKLISCSTIHALVIKNLIKLLRNPSVLIMMIFLPIAMVVTFCLAFGNEAHDIPFVIVNDELPYMSDHCPPYNQECELTNISCRILHHLSKKDTFDFRHSTDIEKAASQLNQGTILGYIYIHANFSDAFFKRLLQPVDLDMDTINQSTIQVHLSQHSFPLTSVMQKSLSEGYFQFLENLLEICEVSEELADLPIKIIDESQFDSDNLPTIQEFLAPGVFVLTVFFLSNVLSGEFFIEERLDGTHERSRVAGVQILEILISYAVTNLGVLIIQTISVIGLVNGAFQVPYYGSFGLLFLITFLQGYCGMSYGLMIASIFTDHAQFNHMMLFTILPVIFLSGVYWTPYSMGSGFLRQFSNLLPNTMAAQAMRDIMTRGWDLSYTSVQMGIGITLIWSLLCNVSTLIVVKIKSK